jgi:hypothetical protein
MSLGRYSLYTTTFEDLLLIAVNLKAANTYLIAMLVL